MASLRNGRYKRNSKTILEKPSPTILCIYTQGFLAKASSLLTTFHKSAEGSMTVEAAMVLPLILSFIMFMGGGIEMMRLHGKVQIELWNIGNQMSMYGYWEKVDNQSAKEIDIGAMFTAGHISTRLEHALGEASSKDGDFQVWVSQDREKDTIEITVTYLIAPYGSSFGVPKIRARNKYFGHMWNGYNVSLKGRDVEEIVYVTENGSVYHRKRDCSYIEIASQRVNILQMAQVEAIEGRKYKPCKICKKEESLPYYFITEYGDSYHSDWNCSAITRTVFSTFLSDVEAYEACSKCADKEK